MDPNEGISILKGSNNEVVVFENRTDTLSFLELLKLNHQTNHRTLISLNSNAHIDQFLSQYQNFQGKFFLCFNGSEAGNDATQKMLNELKNKNIKDIRPLYGISENGNQNLNDYLKNKLNFQQKNINFVEPKNANNDNNDTESRGISYSKQLGFEFSERNSGKPFQNSQSGQNGNYASGQRMGSSDAGIFLNHDEARCF